MVLFESDAATQPRPKATHKSQVPCHTEPTLAASAPPPASQNGHPLVPIRLDCHNESTDILQPGILTAYKI